MNKSIGSLRRFGLGIFVSCILTVSVFTSSWCSPEYRAITILHTNDTHGHLLPFSFPDPRSPKDEYAPMPFKKDIGGIARRATLAHRIESEMRGNVLFMDAGDALDGTPFSIEYMGEADFAAMAAAGYDLMTIGNHEFSASLQEFWRNVNIANFPIVSADIVDRKTGKLALPPYKIFEIDGVKMAVFGLVISTPPTYKAVKEGFDFLDPFKTAGELVPELRKQADVVIALSHLGFDQDQILAKKVPDIDVIVGGHSNNRLLPPVFIEHSEDGNPFSIDGTIIVQDFWWAGELGRLDLRLRRDGGPFTVMSYKGELIPITSDIPDDPATAKVLAKYYKPISKYYGEVIGEATATLYGRSDVGENTALNFVCDAIRESTGAQIGIYNVGGVRGDIVEGPIKVWDIASVLPFRNKMVMVNLTGKRLKQFLIEETPGVSGMTYRIANGNVVEAVVDGKPIDDNAVYTVATTDFLANGRLKDITDSKTLNDDYRLGVISYVKAKKTISPIEDGRRIVE